MHNLLKGKCTKFWIVPYFKTFSFCAWLYPKYLFIYLTYIFKIYVKSHFGLTIMTKTVKTIIAELVYATETVYMKILLEAYAKKSHRITETQLRSSYRYIPWTLTLWHTHTRKSTQTLWTAIYAPAHHNVTSIDTRYTKSIMLLVAFAAFYL